jgi:hypothetical protein
MQAVISREKPVDRPGAEDPLLRFVHLKMNLVPRPVVKHHRGDKDDYSFPGYKGNKRGNWKSLEGRFANRQPYLLVFTTRDGFITEYLGVVLVMHKSVSLEDTLEGRRMGTEEVGSMHQLPVNLVLDKGHQNAREDEPATKLQNKHQRSFDSPVKETEVTRLRYVLSRDVAKRRKRAEKVGEPEDWRLRVARKLEPRILKCSEEREGRPDGYDTGGEGGSDPAAEVM